MRRFVTFEGIDGSGKSTLSKRVFEELERDGYDVVLTFEPTDQPIGDIIRFGIEKEWDPITIAFLFIGDRIEHVKIIKKWLKNGKIVICDRYADSTYAYQGAQLEESMKDSMKWLKNISKNFIIEPDRTFLIDIDPRKSLRRISDRKKLINFEREDFLKKVRENYLKLSNEKRFLILDGKKSIDELAEICIKDILENDTEPFNHD